MKNLFALLSIVIISSCSSGIKEEQQWTNLLDMELSNWDTYLSYKFEDGYKGEQPTDAAGNPLEPIGLNQDSSGVFTTIEENGQPVLKVSGEIYGAVTSILEYKNYHLRLKVKWGQKKWPPREKLLRDSGLLYHATGPNGRSYWRTWMRSQEFQIMEGHFGDYWLTETAIDIRAYPTEAIMSQVADVSQPFIPMGVGEPNPGYCMRSANYENPFGQWNTIELICFEDKSLHIVNGRVVMVLSNSRYVDNGQKVPLTQGKIQLQSEAAEVYFKEVAIRSIAEMPQRYAKYYE
ncbi:MAG: DUF1080 domain-containing protein [Cyclobacteriaceae bacterium]